MLKLKKKRLKIKKINFYLRFLGVYNMKKFLLLFFISLMATFQAEAKTQVLKKEVIKTSKETDYLFNKYVSAESPFVFLIIPKATEEWCSPTGYVPQKYIALYNNISQNINLNKDFKKDSETMKTSMILIESIMKDNYKLGLEDLFLNQGFKNKLDLCRALDSYKEIIVLNFLHDYKSNFPDNFKKYFGSLKLDVLF